MWSPRLHKLAIGSGALCAAALLAWLGHAGINRSGSGATPETTRALRREIRAVVKATGVVRAAIDAEVHVGVQSPGVLRRLHVGIGEHVEHGQILAELEARSLRAKHAQSRAVLRSSQANLRFETIELTRKRELVVRQVLAPRELELAERSFALAEAAVAEANANLASARALLDETRIAAPISGVVASIATREGETVSAGLSAPSLLTLIDLQRLETWAYVDETDIGRIQIGQQASFTVDTYPEYEIQGKVRSIHPKPEIRDNVVDYVVVIGFTAPRDVTLRPEMTANVKIALEARGKVITVSRRALRNDQGRSYVLLLTNGSPTRQSVRTGARDESNIEIIEGLSEGAEVLLTEPLDGTESSEVMGG